MNCPNCGDSRVLDHNNSGVKPGEMMCAACNKFFDSRIIDGVIQIPKFNFKPEHTPYDPKDKDVVLKIKVDKANYDVAIQQKLDEISEQVNILLRKQK